MPPLDSRQTGLKLTIFGLHFTLLGFAVEPGFPFFAAGLAVSVAGFAFD